MVRSFIGEQKIYRSISFKSTLEGDQFNLFESGDGGLGWAGQVYVVKKKKKRFLCVCRDVEFNTKCFSSFISFLACNSSEAHKFFELS